MLKQKIVYFAIEVSADEYKNRVADCFATFEEAFANRANYCGWYESKGHHSEIVKHEITNEDKAVERWTYTNGELTHHWERN